MGRQNDSGNDRQFGSNGSFYTGSGNRRHWTIGFVETGDRSKARWCIYLNCGFFTILSAAPSALNAPVILISPGLIPSTRPIWINLKKYTSGKSRKKGEPRSGGAAEPRVEERANASSGTLDYGISNREALKGRSRYLLIHK